jgi:pilus assembly protein Flp/PilA
MDSLARLLALVLSSVGVVLGQLGMGWVRLHRQVARGQGLVEYALILVLVAIVVIGTLTMLGKQTSQVFDQINCSLAGGPTHVDHGNGNSNRCS